MAHETGVATDHNDLWAKLIAFLTTNVDLVAAGEQWTQVWTASGDVVLQGPGADGDDEILVGLHLHSTPALHVNMMTGLNMGATSFTGHVNCSPNPARAFLTNGEMVYWFTASGRRMILVIRIGTVYETIYAGKFFPYATEEDYAHPYFVGGSSSANNGSVIGPSNTSEGHAAFNWPFYGSGQSSAYFMNPSDVWKPMSAPADLSEPAIDASMWPSSVGVSWSFPTGSGSYGFRADPNEHLAILRNMAPAYGGEVQLIPLSVMTFTSTYNANNFMYGILDGAYAVGGKGLSVEQAVQNRGTDYMVLYDTFRTTSNERWLAVQVQ